MIAPQVSYKHQLNFLLILRTGVIKTVKIHLGLSWMDSYCWREVLKQASLSIRMEFY